MARYRKKPVVIDAVQWLGGNEEAEPVVTWVRSQGGTARYHEPNYLDDEHISIDTLEGKMRAYAGWWIIRDVKGEMYSCRHDVFNETYEEVAE